MSLREGAETIVNQCLKISEDERVVIVNDGNDQDLIDSLVEVVSEVTDDFELVEYEKPENHGEEPPENVATKMKESDVFIAPTIMSISHTEARVNACENGARGATLPGINKEIWNSSLNADYSEVGRITDEVFEMLKDTETVKIETDSGTDLRIDVNIDHYDRDIGLIHEPGEFGNLPAGEADGGSINARGTLVVDSAPFLPDRNEGAELEIKENKVVSMKEEGAEELEEALKDDCARNVAEFGFGTNPEAKLIGNILNDEKVMGTVHVAIGDNSSYFREGERKVQCKIHWDFVCESPTVYFDDQKVMDQGDTIFRD